MDDQANENADGLKALCMSSTPDPSSPLAPAVQRALILARALQQRASELQTPQERKQQTELDRMIHNSRDRATLTQMTDQAFRSRIPHRVSDQLIHVLDVQGIPRFFSPIDRTLLKGFQSFGRYLPGVAVPLVKEKMQHETANVILPAEEQPLKEHLEARRSAGVRMNVNYLGESLLGETEARRRLDLYLHALQLPEIEVISVKISTLYSQISALARDHAVTMLCGRLELLYRAAAKGTFKRPDGLRVPKFVYLDMEEYRDMSITAEAFMRTLDRDGLENVSAGIALQAYIPDSLLTQQKLNEWARRRVAAGGAPVTIRIVKGANMEMERVEASIHGWPQAPFKSKLDTDANYKRMLQEGMRPENFRAVRLGIASHNLFDLAYGLVLAQENNAMDCVQFEMLEGMANPQRRALFDLTQELLLYAPACTKEDFIYAIGYLVRRLDENAGPDNFLRHAFKIHVDSPEWKRLEDGFLQSFRRIDDIDGAPRRNQDRRLPPHAPMGESVPWQQLINEPPTDFSLPQNLAWAKEIVSSWETRCGDGAPGIPLVIAGEEIFDGREPRPCLDPSRPGTCVGRYRQATAEDIEAAVDCAASDPDGWRALPISERSAILCRVAQEIRLARGDLIGAALAEGGKTIAESDPEVSEAVDFVEFYRHSARFFHELPDIESHGKGVAVVVSPWNFPIAIPCGGMAAALAAGNTVILKPASNTVLVAYELCQCFWRGGVSRNALQFAPCSGAGDGSRLVTHPKVDIVILTGGTETARAMLRAKPDMNLLAETGGKNATIVTALADRDQAVKHVVHSAFSHSGQKCSAISLLILEDEVYHDDVFRRALCDAVRSLEVGSAWNMRNRMGPLIRPPRDDLEKGLKELEDGESWAVMPRRSEDNPGVYTPGVKWDVQPGSYTHLTEFFGPLLAVMKARDLHEAIALVNQTGFGLTSGLESLDDREQELWKEGIRAGNLYVNRPTTGAIVLRQPFGGMGKSAFGPGIKAGGPNYVAQLMRFTESKEPATDGEILHPQLRQFRMDLARHFQQDPGILPRSDFVRINAAIGSYEKNMREEFGRAHDHFRLVGQDNQRRYLPIRELRIRAHPEDSPFELFARVCAARIAGCRITVSLPRPWDPPLLSLLEELTDPWAGAIEFVQESDRELAEAARSHDTDRVRFAARSRVPMEVRLASAETGIYLADAPVLMEGRIEMLWYLTEQSISSDYHRYGNLGIRADEERAEPL